MSFDIRTAILGLAVGNLVFGLILLYFQFGEERSQRIPYLITGKLLQGTGWLLLSSRGLLPDWLSFTLGNIVLIIGTAYDTWAMYWISDRPVSRRLQAASAAAIVGLCLVATPLSASARVAVTSLTVMVFFALGGRAMLSNARGNRLLRRHIGVSLGLMVAVLSVRGAWAALAPAHFTLFSANTIQLVMFALLYYLMLTNGFGLLLLAKDRGDRELRESEVRFRSYFELPLIGIAITSPAKGWLEANASACAMLGYSAQELAGMTWAELTHPDDLAADESQFDRVLAGEIDTYGLEKRFIPKSGEAIWTNLSVGCVRKPDRSVEYIVALIQDLTAAKQAEQTLRESETKYRFLAENMKDVVWTLDVETLRFLYVSPAVTQLRGYTPEEVMAEPLDAALTPEGAQSIRNLMHERVAALVASEAGAKPRFYTEEVEQPCKDGATVWTEVITAFRRNAKTGRIEVHGVTRDIRERKRAEEALRASEAKFRDFIEQSSEGVTLTNPQAIIVEWNAAQEKITGIPRAEALGQYIWDIQMRVMSPQVRAAMTPEQVRGLVLRSQKRLEIDSTTGPLEYALYPATGGAPVHIMQNAFPIRGAGGISAGSIFSDITERKKTENALRESEEKFRLAFSNANTAMCLVDLQGHLLQVNDKMCAVFGYSRPELESMTVNALVLPEDVALSPSFISHAVEGSEDSAIFAKRYRHRQGHVIYGEVASSLVRNAEGQPLYFISHVQDFTAREQAEEEIRRLNAELEQRVQARTAQLEATNRELEAFSYSAAHDLRAPLRGIDGWSMALLEDYGAQLDAQAREYLARVRGEAQRMAQLIDALQQLARITRTELRPSTVDLSALARTSAARLQAAQPERQFDFDIQAGLLARGDADLLEIALTNLLANAAKFTGPRAVARIEFGLTQVNDRPTYFVRDNGVGFDVTRTQNLFGAFQRLHRATEFPGTGVGLATVRRILVRHGGQIWAEAAVDQGATFYFALPPAADL